MLCLSVNNEIKNFAPHALPFAHTSGRISLCVVGHFFMEKEYWVESPICKDNYFVSNLGRVKNKNGNIIKPYLAKNGYYFVSLYQNNKQKTIGIHRLVALSFIPNPSIKPMVNHIDGCKTNNDISNLEWCTAKENCHHAWKSGLMENSRQKAAIRMSDIGKRYKDQNGKRLIEFSKLTSKKIAIYSLDGEKIAEYKSIRELRRCTGMQHQDIKRCINKNVPHLRRKIYFKYIND